MTTHTSSIERYGDIWVALAQISRYADALYKVIRAHHRGLLRVGGIRAFINDLSCTETRAEVRRAGLSARTMESDHRVPACKARLPVRGDRAQRPSR